MKTKQFLILGLIALLTIFSAMAQDVFAPEINITLMSQDPDPVAPGRYVELRFKIINDRRDTIAENFQIMLDSTYPFSLDANEEAVKSLGSIPGYGNSRNIQIVKYKVRVDEKAVEGSNPIIVKYKHGKLDWVSQEFYVDIQTVDANLAIISVETNPEMIKPGEKAIVNIKVKNMADSPMKDITMKLDLALSSFLRSTTISATESITAFNAMPFAPLGSATEQKTYTLSSGEEYEFAYNLIAYSDAESRIYKIPIIITYYDELGNQHTKNDIIGLIVGTKPEMSVLIDETDLYVGKKTGIVTVKIINKGFTDIKFLDINAENTDKLEILSAKEVYIGNVDSDDYETADFKVYVNGGLEAKKERNVKFPIIVEYRDANNNFYSDKYELDLAILTQSKLGESSNSGSTGLILIVVLVVVGFFVYRRIRKKKK